VDNSAGSPAPAIVTVVPPAPLPVAGIRLVTLSGTLSTAARQPQPRTGAHTAVGATGGGALRFMKSGWKVRIRQVSRLR
jgi:hypothetical protein